MHVDFFAAQESVRAVVTARQVRENGRMWVNVK